MEIFKELGNVEFLDCFFAWYYKKYGFFKENITEDPRIDIYKEQFESFFKKLMQSEEIIETALCQEAKSRGLSDDFKIDTQKFMGRVEYLIFSDEVQEWQDYMAKHPTYIREISATNYPGDSSVSKDDFTLDFPVREACTILNENGYYTYWSSANREDFEDRKGDVIADKSVAYILIDPQNLNEDLKERLSLNGKNRLWGIAQAHNDNGKYYGIWSEIISADMLCTDLSKDLSNKALELPSLVDVQRKSI